eukprot:TRINITY_DN973_c0_g4_i1.p1 TRINITY_DN973_c0_g4~~TRINITY_DN973_c0_g4_i1.p1  ORF type:complete len:362 (+),score=102.10 TRINITY_DN973_c0_g4_i1:136-1221(+)
MPGADGMSSKFMKNAFVGWTFTAGLYYPPDFDATKLVPLKRLQPKGQAKDKSLNIRMMFPFTMICDACGEYNYTGTKFTSKVEEIKHESYLGIKVFRFYGRCRHCWSEFTFKTDPKNSDYTMESGGKRTYEAWKDADMVEAQLKQEAEEAKSDQMKALEQKSIDVAAEMQRLEDLDAIRTLNKRLGARDQSIEGALEFLFQREREREKAKDELSSVDASELAGFRAEQEEEKRRKLDEEIDADDGPSAGASKSSASGSSGSASGSAGGSSSSGSGSSASGAALLAGAALAAAAAAEKSAASRSVGARFTVKRKAEAPAAAAENEDAKRPRTDAPSAASDAPATTASGGGGLGLGSYDSDSS